ncbi:MAG: hypothetical protein HFI71_11585 [Lachnospiraceae bacterium]|nr:hypothetical protein [Lachnospiraceae bacterium]
MVVYYSATRTTKSVAEKLADLTDTDMYEIVSTETYFPKDQYIEQYEIKHNTFTIFQVYSTIQ